jgi:hypothetical protein
MKAMRVKKIYQTQSKRAKGPKDRRCSAASAINKSPNRNVYCSLDKRCDSPGPKDRCTIESQGSSGVMTT